MMAARDILSVVDSGDDLDPFTDPKAVAADLRVLECIRWARKEFEMELCAASKSSDEDVLSTLRLEAAYHFAEFFFLLKAQGIGDATTMERLAELHNRYLDGLTRNAAKMSRLGLRKDRLLDAIFTSDTRPRLVESWGQGSCEIDQSNLARFLVTVMSSETCRKLVVAAHAAGFLNRNRTPYGTVVVSSTGVMENIFAKVLRTVRRRLSVTE